MKKKYVKIMFLSLTLLTISTTATYAVQPKDDKKENEALQTSTEEHLPLLTINGTNASSSFIVNSEALLGKEITITAPRFHRNSDCYSSQLWKTKSESDLKQY